MKKIELISIEIENFKGIRELKINFNSVTNICGDNATGKTTIFDAFKWLLFDKDSTDRKDFEIKTLNLNNEVIHGLESRVTGVLSIDGRMKTLQKIFREKWTKRRGEAKEVFTGNETLYFINEIPYTQTDYKKQINELADETIFKLITDPLYFSTNLKWQDRRNILLQICGDISNDELMEIYPELNGLKELFEIESSIDNIRKMLSSKKRKFNDEIRNIPPRIDECHNSVKEMDFNSIRTEKNFKTDELNRLENQLLSSVKRDPVRDEKESNLKSIQREISNLKIKAEKQFEEERSQMMKFLFEKKRKNETLQETLSAKRTKEKELQNRLRITEGCINEFRQNWENQANREFIINEHQFICPTCNRLLESANIEERKKTMQENFNFERAKALKEIEEEADKLKQYKNDALCNLQNIKDEIDFTLNSIKDTHNEILKIGEQVETIKPQYGSLYEELIEKASALESELTSDNRIKEDEEIIRTLLKKKQTLLSEIDVLSIKLQQEQTNKTMNARIIELSEKERQLADQMVKLEGEEHLCEQFIKRKVQLLDERINSKFQFVNFKLFEMQINGGIQEICEPLINGVPFSDANNAAKVNAGIDIINTLSEHYKITAPIFIDNREAVNQLIPTIAQIINLIVSNDKYLKVA